MRYVSFIPWWINSTLEVRDRLYKGSNSSWIAFDETKEYVTGNFMFYPYHVLRITSKYTTLCPIYAFKALYYDFRFIFNFRSLKFYYFNLPQFSVFSVSLAKYIAHCRSAPGNVPHKAASHHFHITIYYLPKFSLYRNPNFFLRCRIIVFVFGS